jgi:type II secretory pathway predicted ATPase ExeA
MYEAHFGLRRRPFRTTPDSDCYYPATGHERALSQLSQAIRDEEGLALLTGEPGTGKTLVGHCLLDRLEGTPTTVFLTHSRFSDRTGLLQALLYDLAQPHAGQSEQELRLALIDFLLKNYEAQRRAVFVLDEAQHLTPDLLEELRLLGNLEGRRGKAVQIVLLSQPSLLESVRHPESAAFHQRLAVCAQLEPLGLHEAADYLVHHVRAEGGRPESLFSDEAIEVLARGTHGIPRLLNRAAHQALLLAFHAGATLVDAEAALEALNLAGLADSAEATADRDSVASPLPDQEMPDDSPLAAVPSNEVLALEDEVQANEAPTTDSLPESGRSRRLFVSAHPRRPA